MDTVRIEQDCADDVELLHKRTRSVVDLSIALDRAIRERRQLIGLAERLRAQSRSLGYYHCKACGDIVRLPDDLTLLDSGTTLTCPVCEGMTVVDLDTPADLAQKYRNAAKGATQDNDNQ